MHGAESSGDWLVAAATLVAALVGAAAGTGATYWLEHLRRTREETRVRIASINRALFVLYRYWNELLPYRQGVIDPVRGQPYAWLNADANVSPFEIDQRIDDGHLSFLLSAGESAEYSKLILQQDRFRYTAFIAGEHSRALLDAHRAMALAGAKKGEGLTDEEIIAALGPYLAMRLQVLFAGVEEALDENLPSFKESFCSLRLRALRLFPDAHFIDVDFVETTKKGSEVIPEPEGPDPMAPKAFRVRLRVRFFRTLNITAREHRLKIRGREVVLTSAFPNTKICDSEWLVCNTRGFATPEEAADFGRRLKDAFELSSVSARIGVDAGTNRATTGIGKEFGQTLAEATGHHFRDNVHGLDVFLDDPNIRFPTMQASGRGLLDPATFFVDLDALFDVASNVSTQSRDIVLLLNTALMQPNPVAQIVFAFSAVEMLGQRHPFNDQQKVMVTKAAASTRALGLGSPEERDEVADAIDRLHRLSLRQGVLRLLAELGIGHLRLLWDKTYAERSTLIHGLVPKPGADYSEFANRVVNLCGYILMKAIAIDVPLVGQHVERIYPA